VDTPMPFQPGRAKTGGRQKGTRDKRIIAREQLIADSLKALGLNVEQIDALNAIACMKLVMHHRLKAGDLAGVLEAAIALAPYEAPKLSSSDVRVEHTRKSGEDLLAELRNLKARMQLTIDGEAAPLPGASDLELTVVLPENEYAE